MVKYIDNDFKEMILEKKGVILVDFYAEWCGPCKMLGPIIESLSNEMENVEFFKIDADKEQGLAKACNIQSLPTILIFKDGEVVDKFLGFKPKNDIIKILEKYI
ncbi:MAG: thioredoxin [Sarcina sp.]